MLLILVIACLSIFDLVWPFHQDSEAKPTCVIKFDWDSIEDNLTISWAIPSDVIVRNSVLHPIVTWTTDYNYGNCTITTLTSCICYYGDHTMDSDSIFTLNVTVLGEDNDSVFQAMWDFDSQECLRPLPVPHVNVTSVNSTCLNVTWERRLSCDETFDDMVYRISYKQRDEPKDWQIFLCGEACARCLSVYVFCGLRPNTGYDVTVESKFSNLDDEPIGHWSDVTVTTAFTAEDVPYGSPYVLDGGFTLLKESCASRNNREIRIYWKEVDEGLRNGEITAYQITVINQEVQYRVEFNTPINTCYFDVNLQCTKGYTILVRAGTKMGMSAKFAHMHIPVTDESSELLSGDDVVPEINMIRQLVNVTLTGRGQNTVQQYVVWREHSERFTCASAINWKKITSTSRDLTFQTSNAHVPLYDLKVGVANVNTGITWATCLYTLTFGMTRPNNLHVIPSSVGKNKIEIGWDNLGCVTGHLRPYVARIAVYVCPTPATGNPGCDGPTTVAEVDGKSHSYIVDHLDMNTVYKIHVAAVGLHGRRSPQSEPIYAQPHYKQSFIGSAPSYIVLCGSILIVVLFMSFVIRCALKRAKHFYKRMTETEDPPIYALELMEPNG